MPVSCDEMPDGASLSGLQVTSLARRPDQLIRRVASGISARTGVLQTVCRAAGFTR